MLDLRQILTKYRIDWRDRGSNTSKGNVNIPCPLCKTDPSYHLALSEEGKGWYCWRNAEHNGRHLSYIFSLLKIPTDLLPAESKSAEWVEPKQIPGIEQHRSFIPATESDEALLYMFNRGFEMPEHIVRDFDLKVALGGEWAGRIIIPLTEGWTGRTMRTHIEPRYKSEFNERSFWYSGRAQSRRWILLEGAFDGMRIASVSQQFNIVAMCGQKLSPAILNLMRDKQPSSVYIVPDQGVPVLSTFNAGLQLRSYLRTTETKVCEVPSEFKDPCEMSSGQCLRWLNMGNFVSR